MVHFMFRDSEARTSQLIKMGGVYLPPLKSYSVQYYDLQTNSYRDITGEALLHKETICRDKIKLVCEWGYTSSTEAQTILNCCSEKEFVECTFFNPLKLQFDTINVYRGDREVSVYRTLFNEDGSVDIDYSSVKVNFIQQ